jgi:hypothetical protein
MQQGDRSNIETPVIVYSIAYKTEVNTANEASTQNEPFYPTVNQYH